MLDAGWIRYERQFGTFTLSHEQSFDTIVVDTRIEYRGNQNQAAF